MGIELILHSGDKEVHIWNASDPPVIYYSCILWLKSVEKSNNSIPKELLTLQTFLGMKIWLTSPVKN